MYNNENDMTINLTQVTPINNIVHEARENETLEDIVAYYNQTKQNLNRVNNLGNSIEAGDLIIIPRKNIATYIVKPLDTLERIADKFEVSKEHIKNNNSIEKIFIGQILII